MSISSGERHFQLVLSQVQKLMENSLRGHIGIVSQSPILFDDTIMNNVRYACITASDEEVYEACRAACIHDKIKDFTHGKLGPSVSP